MPGIPSAPYTSPKPSGPKPMPGGHTLPKPGSGQGGNGEPSVRRVTNERRYLPGYAGPLPLDWTPPVDEAGEAVEA